ncbi:MAG: SH3 domain-containing protein [Leptospiraceae bacterium]|nr:SH3 domain-containing protein [Leptospiraceae bacterium]
MVENKVPRAIARADSARGKNEMRLAAPALHHIAERIVATAAPALPNRSATSHISGTLDEMLRSLISILLLAFFVFHCGDDEVEGRHSSRETTQHAIIADGVRIRSEPKTESEIVGAVYRGDTVIVSHYTEASETINGRTAYWAHIEPICDEYPDGWVFGAFLGDFETSAASTYEHAEELQDLDPAAATNLYHKIATEYSRATRVLGCHGTVSWQAEVTHKLAVMKCLKQKGRTPLPLDALASQLRAAIQARDRTNLEKLAHCDFSIYGGPIDDFYLPQEGIDEVLKILDNYPADFEGARVEADPPALDLKVTRHYFGFRKLGSGYLWDYFADE